MSFLDRALRMGEAKKFKSYEQRVGRINLFEEELELESDEELRERMDNLRERAGDGESLDDLLYECFAIVREVGKRRLPNEVIEDTDEHVVEVHHTPLGVAGQLVAARLGVPSVLHAVGFGHTGAHVRMINNTLAPAYERHGLEGPTPVASWLDIAPPSMSSTAEPRRWFMRYVPYNGGGRLPDWLSATRERPRVTVTLGTVRPVVDGVSPVKWVVDAARETDAEFVLALGGGDLSALGTLPDNVRPVGWIPLGLLLARSDAVIHHGGSGTTLTALDAGLPQIVLGEGADRPANAAAVHVCVRADTYSQKECEEISQSR